MAIACNSFTSGSKYYYGRLAMELRFNQQHDKNCLCRYMVVCNPINDVAGKNIRYCRSMFKNTIVPKLFWCQLKVGRSVPILKRNMQKGSTLLM